MSRPLSSAVSATHEPSLSFGTVNSFSTLKPGSVTNVFAGTFEPGCTIAVWNTLPHGCSPYLAIFFTATPFSPFFSLAVHVSSLTTYFVPAFSAITSLSTNPLGPPSFHTSATNSSFSPLSSLVTSASAPSCHSSQVPTSLPLRYSLTWLSAENFTFAVVAVPSNVLRR